MKVYALHETLKTWKVIVNAYCSRNSSKSLESMCILLICLSSVEMGNYSTFSLISRLKLSKYKNQRKFHKDVVKQITKWK